jgi:VanZ family protein
MGPEARRSLWRRACVVGSVVQLAIAIGLSALAYRNKLPKWAPTFHGADKLAHFFVFGGLAFFFDGALGYRRLWPRAPAFVRLAPIVVWIAVALDEYMQRFSPHRSSDWRDLLADTLGIAFLSWVSRRIDERVGRA